MQEDVRSFFFLGGTGSGFLSHLCAGCVLLFHPGSLGVAGDLIDELTSR